MLTAIFSFFVFLLAWVFCGIYRKWPLDIIESSCILNLGLLAVVTNYIQNDGNNQSTQSAVVNASVGTVFVSFIVVLVYQAYKQLATSLFLQRCGKKNADCALCMMQQIILHGNASLTYQ